MTTKAKLSRKWPFAVLSNFLSKYDCPNQIDPPNPPMSPKQQEIADSLTQEFIQRIDDALLSHARPRERKVAMLLGLTMMDPEMRVPGLLDLFYAERVRALVEKGALVAEGNLDFMQYSEVRLP